MLIKIFKHQKIVAFSCNVVLFFLKLNKHNDSSTFFRHFNKLTMKLVGITGNACRSVSFIKNRRKHSILFWNAIFLIIFHKGIKSNIGVFIDFLYKKRIKKNCKQIENQGTILYKKKEREREKNLFSIPDQVSIMIDFVTGSKNGVCYNVMIKFTFAMAVFKITMGLRY